MTTVVIVGSSVGGVRTAQALRSEGFQGRIVLLGEEVALPYDRPPLSKGFLSGLRDKESLLLITEVEAQRLDIELMLGMRCVAVDIANSSVRLRSGAVIQYDRLVIATGSCARPSPWDPMSGTHSLRTSRDAEALRADLLSGGPVVVIGAGFIGSEVASTARLMGLDVTMVDPLPVPMSRVLNSEVGGWFTDLHHRHGVDTRFGVGVEEISGSRGNLRVTLTNGDVVKAATAIVGIGALPNDQWLESSGLIINDGVVCNEFCRAIDREDVFAVGDVCRWFHIKYGTHVRVEHWTNAVDQAACVAHNIAWPQDQRAYEAEAYVWSEQYDWKVQVAGRTGGVSDHWAIGNPKTDERFGAVYSHDGAIISGAAVVNWPRGLLDCRRAITTGSPVADILAQLAPSLT